MRAFEFLGIGVDKNFRSRGDQSMGFFTASSRQGTADEPIKGMVPPVEPVLDPDITNAIIESMPKPPTKRRMVGTYAKWISDPIISPAETNPEFVNVLRAVVSDSGPMPIDQVAELAGTEKERVEDLVRNAPFIKIDTVDGQKQVGMPEVETYIAEWKEKAIESLPEGTEPEIVDQLLTPSPAIDHIVFDANPTE